MDRQPDAGHRLCLSRKIRVDLPFHREDIALCYDGYAVDAHSVDEAMALPFICGHSLAELCEELDI